MKKIFSIAMIFIFCLSISPSFASVGTDVKIEKTFKSECEKTTQFVITVEKNVPDCAVVTVKSKASKTGDVKTSMFRQNSTVLFRPEIRTRTYPNDDLYTKRLKTLPLIRDQEV